MTVSPADILIDGVKIISLDFAFQSRLKRILFASKKIFDTAVDIKADIYHLHDPELLRIAVKLKRKTASRVIYDSHEDLPKQVLDKHWIPSLFRNSISKFIYRYEMNKASKIDGVISVTDKICKRFLKVNDNVCLVANFPILSNQNKDYSITKKYDNTICYIGGLFPKRGIKELVQALDYCDAILHLAGSFSSKKFEKEVKSLKGWSKVNFHGYVSKNKIDEILLQSNIGIVILHPTESYKESLPIKMFEYMSAGLPVVASDFPEWKKIFDDFRLSRCKNIYKRSLRQAKLNHISNPLLTFLRNKLLNYLPLANFTVRDIHSYDLDAELKKII